MDVRASEDGGGLADCRMGVSGGIDDRTGSRGMPPPSRWTVPNALSATRLLGVPVLFVLVRREPVAWFAALYALLGITDWLDGKLARAWSQTSAFGSMLDAVADVAYYVSTAYFAVRLFPAYVRPNLPYIVGCLALYAALMVVSRARVGRILLPHTHLSTPAASCGCRATDTVQRARNIESTWLERHERWAAYPRPRTSRSIARRPSAPRSSVNAFT